jgi:hypothetical protein
MRRVLALALATSVARADVRLATGTEDIGSRPNNATALAAFYHREEERKWFRVHHKLSFIGVAGRVRALEIDPDGAWGGAKGWGICSVQLHEHLGEGLMPPREEKVRRLLVWRNGKVDGVYEEHLQPRIVNAGCKLLCLGSGTANCKESP